MCRHTKRPLKYKVSTLNLDQFDAHAACVGIQKGHWKLKYKVSTLNLDQFDAHAACVGIQKGHWKLKYKVSTLNLDQFDAHAACVGIRKGHWNTKSQRCTGTSDVHLLFCKWYVYKIWRSNPIVLGALVRKKKIYRFWGCTDHRCLWFLFCTWYQADLDINCAAAHSLTQNRIYKQPNAQTYNGKT